MDTRLVDLPSLWSVRVSSFVKIEQHYDDKILRLFLKVDGISMVFINVYLPYAAQHNLVSNGL